MKSLDSLPYDQFDISEEVQEQVRFEVLLFPAYDAFSDGFAVIFLLFQVELVRSQLQRAKERYGGPVTSNLLARALSQPLNKEIDPLQSGSRGVGSLHLENVGNIDHEVRPKLGGVPLGNSPNGNDCCQIVQEPENLRNSSKFAEVTSPKSPDLAREDDSPSKNLVESKKPNSPIIPEEYLCPISLELLRDPVIVATGQVPSSSV